jgi:hypothetical protein
LRIFEACRKPEVGVEIYRELMIEGLILLLELAFMILLLRAVSVPASGTEERSLGIFEYK